MLRVEINGRNDDGVPKDLQGNGFSTEYLEHAVVREKRGRRVGNYDAIPVNTTSSGLGSLMTRARVRAF
jgi:hypothetical protein